MGSLFKIFKILTKRQLHLCILLVIAMLFGAVLEAGGIALLYPLISIIGKSDFLETHKEIAQIVAKIGIHTHSTFVIFSSLLLLLFFLFKNIFVFLETRFQIYFSVNNQCEYTKKLFDYYLNKPYLYHIKTNSAILLRNISSGSSSVFQKILINTLALITECTTAIVIWVTIFLVDYVLALAVAFIMVPMCIAILKAFRKKISEQGKIQRNYNGEYVKALNQGLGSIKETKVMQTEDFFTETFGLAYTKYSNAIRDYLVIEKIPRALIETAGIGGVLLLIVFKVGTGSNPMSLIPTLGVLALAAVRLMPCMNRVMQYFNSIKFSMPYFNELYDDFLLIRDKKEQMVLKKNTTSDKKPICFEKSIIVKDLVFKYPGNDKVVIDGASMEIPKGSFVGIVGQSGAGKTTFVDILLGLLPPISGDILIDNKSLFDNTSGWLKLVGYVPQSIYLVDGSIKENIALGVPSDKISDKRIQEVMDMAQLTGFVSELPCKDKTIVGERGTRLSGGQRQRIGIARALYKNPKVLILDEATSALDNETEKSITKTILSLKGVITIISIAHRLSTLEDCDFKIRFENGKAIRV